jgi:hypothetical protein
MSIKLFEPYATIFRGSIAPKVLEVVGQRWGSGIKPLEEGCPLKFLRCQGFLFLKWGEVGYKYLRYLYMVSMLEKLKWLKEYSNCLAETKFIYHILGK